MFLIRFGTGTLEVENWLTDHLHDTRIAARAVFRRVSAFHRTHKSLDLLTVNRFQKHLNAHLSLLFWAVARPAIATAHAMHIFQL